MLYHAPRHLPPLSLMVADLGNPSAATLAQALDVSPSTVRRWLAREAAPRAAWLALFWCTQWGRSVIDAAAVNEAAMLRSLAGAQADELGRMRAQVARLIALGDFGSANDPARVTVARRRAALRLVV
jgi:hypothetical protein